MTTAGSSDITPDPSIHNVPAQDSDVPTPASAQQIQEWAQLILQGALTAVADALLNVNVLGVSPESVLEEFGVDPAGIISTIVGVLGGTGTGTAGLTSALENVPLIGPLVEAITGSTGTLSDLETWAASIPVLGTVVTDVVSALTGTGGLLSGFTSGSSVLSQLTSALGGSGSAISDFVTAVENTGTTISDVITSLTGSGGLLNGFTSGSSILSQLITAAGGSGSSLSSFGAIFDNLLSGTTFQSLLDEIANALGISGTGHTIANIGSYLSAIPQSNITGLASALSGLVSGSDFNSLLTALFGSGTVGSTIQVGAIPTGIPQSSIAGLTSALSGLLSGSTFQSLIDGVVGGSGNPVSALISSLTGTASTATSASSAASSAASAASTALSDAGTALSNAQAVIDSIYNAVTGSSSTNNPVTAVESSIGGILGGIVSQLTGQSASTATQSQANAALAAQAAALASANAALQALQNQNTAAANGGVNINLNFSTYTAGSSITGLTETYSPSGYGTLGITSGTAAFQPTGSTDYTAIAIHPTATMTDYQMVSCVFASVPSQSYGAWVENAYNTLICRANATSNPTTYVYAELTPTTVSLRAVNSGTDTQLVAPKGIEDFGAGAPFTLIAGLSGTTPIYELYSGTSLLMSFTDNSSVTHYGSGYRYCGFGGYYNDDHGLNLNPGALTSFGFVDNGPISVIGSGFRQYRASTTAVSTTVNTVELFPASFFDSNSYQTSDFTYTSSTNKLTVANTGWYLVRINSLVQRAAAAQTYSAMQAVLYHNGSIAQYGRSNWFYQYASATYPAQWFGDHFMVYCNAGDYLQPGYLAQNASSAGSMTIAGDGTGDQTYFEANFIGPQAA